MTKWEKIFFFFFLPERQWW